MDWSSSGLFQRLSSRARSGFFVFRKCLRHAGRLDMVLIGRHALIGLGIRLRISHADSPMSVACQFGHAQIEC